ncbi:dihydrofolate reductase family protein [Frankia sp. CNm7]|uniref:Dihydrofolate reductase family protein n=1 Tax=Frankia nepalensis TaxID=1836974 RepID=A0A937RJ64_9ACTN|nr:dihydrofolate reductase family protein [Frankia nepalensis]MBL7497909.1 dihydrofolate reductase family protein [Frankia nepalensis]MBL7513813.1 dihydrofolate reductase family protein [Frankia nepalensis]MBL7519768.1 dihydrofolate reductase family protein [Frankia nepalensis]MBL7629935.1 dihydrofolate reductase family protein [Frankia nepalensis]
MRPLTAHYFVSVDGIVDSPQDWHFPYANPEVMSVVGEATAGVDALLMGRRTFEEWRAFWPGQSGFPLADFINNTHKYVVTGTLSDPGWGPATILAGDAVPAVRDLKDQPGGRIAINGSGTLTRALLRAGLVDELHLLVHPVVVGAGRHLFEDGGAPVGLDLAAQRTFGNGVTYHVYKPAAADAAAAAA